MKKILILIIIAALPLICQAQQKPNWEKWSWLTGNWIGEGEGQPGQRSGTFSFSFDLDQNILVRKSHSEYPATGNRPATVHNDLMVIYPDNTGNPAKAVYFDNEGHTIFYTVTFSDISVVMTSEFAQGSPAFRLSYLPVDSSTVAVRFEISTDAVNFRTYIEGKSKKIQAGN